MAHPALHHFTPMGTYDPVGPRDPRRVRRAFAVLVLSGFTTLLVAGTASAAMAPPAAPAQGGGSSTTEGGCSANVGGQPIGRLDADHPLQVHKGQRVVLTGQAPADIRAPPSSLALRSTTDVKIHVVEKLATRTETPPRPGRTSSARSASTPT